MYLYVRPTLLYRLRGLAVAWKSRYLMLTSDRRPRHPVYRAGTATWPSWTSKALGSTWKPCTARRTCTKVCGCDGCWGRVTVPGSCRGNTPVLDIVGEWHSTTPPGGLRSFSAEAVQRCRLRKRWIHGRGQGNSWRWHKWMTKKNGTQEIRTLLFTQQYSTYCCTAQHTVLHSIMGHADMLYWNKNKHPEHRGGKRMVK